MFAILLIRYQVDARAVAPYTEAHRNYLAALGQQGFHVKSEPFAAGGGEALILEVRDRAEAEQLLAAEPYAKVGVATHELHLFIPQRGALSERQVLVGKVAIVSGASSGIGEAVALALAEHGASLALVARRQERLDALALRVRQAGGEATSFALDLTEKGEPGSLVERVGQRYGRLDLVVSSAGIMLLSPIAEATDSEWRRMIELNLIALMELTRAALPGLRASKGHVVNIASLAGRIANPNASGYAASKFGVVGFSESLRREVFSDGVRVTVIEPGVVATELGEQIENAAMRDGLRARLAELEPLRANDVARAVIYAVTQPAHVNVNEIALRPTGQER